MDKEVPMIKNSVKSSLKTSGRLTSELLYDIDNNCTRYDYKVPRVIGVIVFFHYTTGGGNGGAGHL